MTTAEKNIEIQVQGSVADVLIYDRVGASFFEDGVTAKAFAEQLSAAGKGIKTINVRINSPGGSVFDGTAIYNTLINHPARIIAHIDGAALSVASLIAMAGDEIRMASNGFLMIHDPSGRASGGPDEMRRMAGLLESIKKTMVDVYSKRTGQTAEEVARLMAAETWMDATEAKRLGFANSITEKAAIAAEYDLSDDTFANMPERFKSLLNFSQEEPKMPEAVTPAAPVAVSPTLPEAANYEQIVANCPGIDAAFICEQLKAKATLPQAQAAWMAEQNKRIEAANKAAEDLKAAAAKPGVPALGTTAGGKTAPEAADGEQFWTLVNAKVAAGMPKARAIAAVAKANPEAHRAMLIAHNQENGRREAARKLQDVA